MQPVLIDGEEALSIGESADYMGMSRTALGKRIEKFNGRVAEDFILKYSQGGSKRFIKISDLDRLKKIREVKES